MSGDKLQGIFSLVLRSYFIRLFYNYSCLCGDGLIFCTAKVIPQKLKVPSGSCPDADVFNTNEHLSGFAIGIVLNSQKNGRDEKYGKTVRILTSVLGSAGDRLINGLLLPVFILAGLNMAALYSFRADSILVSFFAAEVITFNVIGFSLRYFGIKRGYSEGLECLKIFASPSYRRTVSILGKLKTFLYIFLIINLSMLLFF